MRRFLFVFFNQNNVKVENVRLDYMGSCAKLRKDGYLTVELGQRVLQTRKGLRTSMEQNGLLKPMLSLIPFWNLELIEAVRERKRKF